MRRTLLAGAIATALAVLIAGFAIPALALGGSEEDETETLNPPDWEAMYEACLNGDWEGMLDEMEQFFTDMPCFGAANTGPEGESQTPGAGWDGHMDGGMMGDGWDGHMDSGMMGDGWDGHMDGGMMGW